MDVLPQNVLVSIIECVREPNVLFACKSIYTLFRADIVAVCRLIRAHIRDSPDPAEVLLRCLEHAHDEIIERLFAEEEDMGRTLYFLEEGPYDDPRSHAAVARFLKCGKFDVASNIVAVFGWNTRVGAESLEHLPMTYDIGWWIVSTATTMSLQFDLTLNAFKVIESSLVIEILVEAGDHRVMLPLVWIAHVHGCDDSIRNAIAAYDTFRVSDELMKLYKRTASVNSMRLAIRDIGLRVDVDDVMLHPDSDLDVVRMCVHKGATEFGRVAVSKFRDPRIITYLHKHHLVCADTLMQVLFQAKKSRALDTVTYLETALCLRRKLSNAAGCGCVENNSSNHARRRHPTRDRSHGDRSAHSEA